jgi:hypothetical protein
MNTRRSFLRNVTLAAAGAAVLPAFSTRASAKSGTKLPVTGTGEHTYECVHDWLLPPTGMVWGETHAVCQDKAGNIYVAHTVNQASMRGEAVVVYDSEGRFIRAFGEEFRGGAHGLDIRIEGGQEVLFHCDINRSKTVRTTLTGEVLWSHAYPMEDRAYSAAPTKYRPTNAAFAPNGDYYVADGYGSSHILRYAADGQYLGEIGRPATGDGAKNQPDGDLKTPHDLWVDDRGAVPVLVVADRSNMRIQIFSLEGKHLRTVTDPHMRLPCDVHTNKDWLVCADLDSQVLVLDRDYRIAAQLGDGKAHNGVVGSRRTQTRDQFTPGEFICPHDAIFLQNGNILVSEFLPIGRITLLRRV